MLATLSIRNFVLIDSLDIDFSSGLCVLTGETGAGKSILLDALSLAIGARADASQVRGGIESGNRASIAATFELLPGNTVLGKLEEHDVDLPMDGDPLILRRTVTADGRSRAYINDQPISVGTLRNIGESLIEIEGQFASHGLLDPQTIGTRWTPSADMEDLFKDRHIMVRVEIGRKSIGGSTQRNRQDSRRRRLLASRPCGARRIRPKGGRRSVADRGPISDDECRKDCRRDQPLSRYTVGQ